VRGENAGGKGMMDNCKTEFEAQLKEEARLNALIGLTT
jgi:hypothetical protein